MWKKSLIPGLLVPLLLVACASPPPHKLSRPEFHSIATIAALQEVIALGYRGVFSTYSETVPVDWDLNDAAHSILDRELSRAYTVRDITFGSNQLQQLEAAHPASNKLSDFEMLGQRLRSMVHPGTADAIVVIGGTGLGNAFLGHRAPQPTYVGLVYDLAVFDGKTFELLGTGYAGPQTSSAPLGVDWNGDPFASIPAQEKERIRSLVTSTLTLSIPSTLRDAGLLHQ